MIPVRLLRAASQARASGPCGSARPTCRPPRSRRRRVTLSPKWRRHGCDAKVQLAAVEPDPDAAVLRRRRSAMSSSAKSSAARRPRPGAGAAERAPRPRRRLHAPCARAGLARNPNAHRSRLLVGFSDHKVHESIHRGWFARSRASAGAFSSPGTLRLSSSGPAQLDHSFLGVVARPDAFRTKRSRWHDSTGNRIA